MKKERERFTRRALTTDRRKVLQMKEKKDMRSEELKYWTRVMEDDPYFLSRFLEWCEQKGYLKEFARFKEEEHEQVMRDWKEETERLESKGHKWAADVAWEKVNQ